MSPLINLLILLFFNMINSQKSSFRFNWEPFEEECLLEYFPDKTWVIYDILSNISTIIVNIKSPEQDIITSETSLNMKFPFTTYSGGYYEACIKNVNDTNTSVTFNLQYGVAAKDYSSIARTKDLQPIDLELEKLSDRTKHMTHYVNFAQSHEQVFEAQLDSISSKIVFFSVVVMGIMFFIGIVETMYLKKFMEKRKII